MWDYWYKLFAFYIYNKQNNYNIKGKKVEMLESMKCASVSQIWRKTQPIAMRYDNDISDSLKADKSKR